MRTNEPGETSERHLRAAIRIAAAAGVGVVACLGVSPFVAWQVSTMIGWDVAAVAFVVWVWLEIGRSDATTTHRISMREDGSRRATEVFVLAACVASLGGVGAILLEASAAEGLPRAALTALAVASVTVSWFAVHTVFTLRYAHLYYREDGGIDFNERHRRPDYGDFAYLAFTIGMTYQVSDTNLTSKPIRMTALRHAFVSFLFGIVIVAMTINVVASLLRG